MASRELADAHTLIQLSQSNSAVQVEKTGLLFSGRTPLSSWEDIGKQILSVADSSTWWIADWLVYGEDTFKDRYVAAVAKTSLSYQTLRNYAWVARRFSHARRRGDLSFGHHSEVAALDTCEQDYWLRKAQNLNWSRNHLRRQVRNSLRERSDPANEAFGVTGNPGGCGTEEGGGNGGEAESAAATSTLKLVLTSDQITVFEQTADAHNMELEEWVIGILESAARSRAGR